MIQSICLFPVLRRAGFTMRLRWDLRRDEIGEIGRMAGWMFGYVASQALGNLVVQRAANAATNTALRHGVTTTAYYTIYSNAWQLFQLPYAIVGISVISALLPRMSGHASERRYSLVRDDFSKGVRIASVIVVPAAVFLAVMGAPLCEFLFAHGSPSLAEAREIGEVFGVFALGLVPFMLTQLQLRVFYSFHQNRTPAIIGMVMLIVGVIGAVVALTVLPYSQTVIGLAVAYDLVSLTGALIAWPLLLRRVGSLDGWRITRSLVRMLLATLPGLVFIFVIIAVVGSFHAPGAAVRLRRHGDRRRRRPAALRALRPDTRHRRIPHPDAVCRGPVRVDGGRMTFCGTDIGHRPTQQNTSRATVRYLQESHITVGASLASGQLPTAVGSNMGRARGVRANASHAVIVDIQGLEGGRESAPLLA